MSLYCSAIAEYEHLLRCIASDSKYSVVLVTLAYVSLLVYNMTSKITYEGASVILRLYSTGRVYRQTSVETFCYKRFVSCFGSCIMLKSLLFCYR